jgi:hypothetical protein
MLFLYVSIEIINHRPAEIHTQVNLFFSRLKADSVIPLIAPIVPRIPALNPERAAPMTAFLPVGVPPDYED